MADRYWVGNSGIWTDMSHWALTSGVAGGQSVPTKDDNVFIDNGSFSQPGCTIDSSMATYCNSISINNINYSVSCSPSELFVYKDFIYEGYTLFSVSGGYATVAGSQPTSIDNFIFTCEEDGATISIMPTTINLDVFDIVGTDISHRVNLNSLNPAHPFHINKTSGIVNLSYVTITDSHATGGATFNAFAANGNVNGGGNSGWDFRINRYWVGNGSSSWDFTDPNNWSETSGGTVAASTQFDDYSTKFHIDENSLTEDNQLINMTSDIYIRDFDTTGSTHLVSLNYLDYYIVYLNGDTLILTDNVSIISTGQYPRFDCTAVLSDLNITTSNSLKNIDVYLQESDYSYILNSDINFSSLCVDSSLVSNNYSIYANYIIFNNTSLSDLGTSTFYTPSFNNESMSDFTGTTIVLTTDVINYYANIYSSNDLGDIELVSSYFVQLDMYFSICNNFTFNGYGRVSLSYDLEVSETLTLTGTNGRIFFASACYDTTIIVYAGIVNLSNVDFKNIHAQGNSYPPFPYESWTGTLLGNAGGNHNISTDYPAAVYWVDNGGVWSDPLHWSDADGGVPGTGRVPLLQDTAIFTNNSITTPAQQIIFSNDIIVFPNLYFRDVLNSPEISFQKNVYIFLGGFELVEGMTVIANDSIRAQGGVYFDFCGIGNIYAPLVDLQIMDISIYGSISVQSDLKVSSFYTDPISTLYLNSFILTVVGNSLDGDNPYVDFEGVLDAGTSTVVIDMGYGNDGQFYSYGDAGPAGPLIHNNVRFQNAIGDIGENAKFEVDDVTQFNSISFLNSGYDVKFSNSSTFICNEFHADGEAGKLIGLIAVSNSGAQWGINVPSGEVNVSYCQIHDSNATGGATFNALSDCVDLGNNTGWNLPLPSNIRYWVGDGGLWNDTSHWSMTSGGVSGASIPDETNVVVFDENSITDYEDSIIIDQLNVPTLDFTNILYSPEIVVSSGGSNNFNIYGDLILKSGMTFITYSLTYINFVGGNRNIITNGVSLYGFIVSLTYESEINVSSDIECSGLSQIANSMMYLNSNTVTVRCSSNRTPIDVMGTSGSSGTGRFDGGTSTLIVDFDTYVGEVHFSALASQFYNVIFRNTGPSLSNVLYFDSEDCIFNDISFENPPYEILFGGGQTVYANGFAANGLPDNLFIMNVTGEEGFLHWELNISSGIVEVNYVSLTNSHATGGATFNAINSLDGRLNFGWNFINSLNPVRYWVNNGGYCSDVSHWSLTGGGTGGASVPDYITNIVFDEHSITVPGETITLDLGEEMFGISSLDFTNILNNPRLYIYYPDSPYAVIVTSGNLILKSGMIVESYNEMTIIIFIGDCRLRTNGVELPNIYVGSLLSFPYNLIIEDNITCAGLLSLGSSFSFHDITVTLTGDPSYLILMTPGLLNVTGGTIIFDMSSGSGVIIEAISEIFPDIIFRNAIGYGSEAVEFVVDQCIFKSLTFLNPSYHIIWKSGTSNQILEEFICNGEDAKLMYLTSEYLVPPFDLGV